MISYICLTLNSFLSWLKYRAVGLSMMCYTFGKAERTCKGERQARGLIGKLLY